MDPVVDLYGRNRLAANNNTISPCGCVDMETDVLTEHGFRRFDQVTEGDVVYTWKDGVLSLDVIRKIIQIPYSGYLHTYTGRGYSRMVTPDKKMIVRKQSADKYLTARSNEVLLAHTPYILPVSFQGSAVKPCKLSDNEIRLAAMAYTDGNFDFRGGSIHKITIYKSPNRIGNKELLGAFHALGILFSIRTKQGAFGPVNKYILYGESARYLVRLCGSKDKIADTFLSMSQRQAELFLTTWATFDGDEMRMRCQYDNNIIRDQLQQIAVLAGKCSYIHTEPLPSGKTVNYVKIRQVDNIRTLIRAAVPYDGIVWYPVTESGTAVFRRNGCVYIG